MQHESHESSGLRRNQGFDLPLSTDLSATTHSVQIRVVGQADIVAAISFLYIQGACTYVFCIRADASTDHVDKCVLPRVCRVYII